MKWGPNPFSSARYSGFGEYLITVYFGPVGLEIWWYQNNGEPNRPGLGKGNPKA